MSTLAELTDCILTLDAALTSLLAELRRQGQCSGHITNLQIVQAAEEWFVSLRKENKSLRECSDKQLLWIKAAEEWFVSLRKENKSLRECSDKQLLWIKAAMAAVHPECEVTADAESWRGKSLRIDPEGQIARLKEIAFQSQEAAKTQTQRADSLQAQLKGLQDHLNNLVTGNKINGDLIKENETLAAEVEDLQERHESLRAWAREIADVLEVNSPARGYDDVLAAVKRLKAQVTRLELAAAQPKTDALRQLESWTLEERQAILTLAMQKDMSPANVLKQALRHYQMQATRYTIGATMGSGDPEPSISWQALMKHQQEKAKVSGPNNPLFAAVDVHCTKSGQVFTTPAPGTVYTVGVDMGAEELLPGKPGQSIVVEGGIASYSPAAPDAVKVALETAALPLGSAIRFASDPGSESLITGRNQSYVWLGSATKGVDGSYLMNERAEYRAPGTEDWKPCYNLVNPT